MTARNPLLALCIVCTFILIPSSHSPGQDALAKKGQFQKFVAAAMERLKGEQIEPVEAAKVEGAAKSYGANQRSKEAQIALVKAINSAAKATGTKSEVNFETTRGQGAFIRYQTVDERVDGKKARRIKTRSNTKEELLIGYYHIWAERKGEATSDPDEVFPIVNLKEPVTLDERSSPTKKPRE